jgi:hypothetical protein
VAFVTYTKKDPLSTTTLWAATAAPNAPNISAPWSSTTWTWWKEIPASSKVENRNMTSQTTDLCIGEQVQWVSAAGYGLVYEQL